MRENHRIQTGVVVSDKMNKTVVVAVERRMIDSRYKRYVKQIRKFKAHDEKNACKVGDRVEIVETRPLSREKCWAVQKILARNKAALPEAAV